MVNITVTRQRNGSDCKGQITNSVLHTLQLIWAVLIECTICLWRRHGRCTLQLDAQHIYGMSSTSWLCTYMRRLSWNPLMAPHPSNSGITKSQTTPICMKSGAMHLFSSRTLTIPKSMSDPSSVFSLAMGINQKPTNAMTHRPRKYTSHIMYAFWKVMMAIFNLDHPRMMSQKHPCSIRSIWLHHYFL